MELEDVMEAIAAGIDERLYRAGHVLQAYAVVAKALGTTKTKIEHAVERLQRENPPRVTKLGKKRFKLELIHVSLDLAPPSDAAGLQELAYMRAKLESWVASQAAQALLEMHDREKRPIIARLMEERAKWMSDASMRTDPNAAIAADRALHAFVKDIATRVRSGDRANRYSQTILTEIVSIIRVHVGNNQRILRQEIPGYAEETMRQHVAIVDALLRRDRQAAYGAMHRHLRYAAKHMAGVPENKLKLS